MTNTQKLLNQTITCINTNTVKLTITAYQDWKTKGFNRHLLQVDHSHEWHSSDVTKRESQKFICPVVLLYPHSDLGITGVKVNKSFQILAQDVGVHAASDLRAGGGHSTPGAWTKRGQALCCSVTVCKTREQNCYLLFVCHLSLQGENNMYKAGQLLTQNDITNWYMNHSILC